MFSKSRMKERFTSYGSGGWRTSNPCPFCACPILIAINLILNGLAWPSSDCYRMGLLLAVNFTLVTIKIGGEFLPPSILSLIVSLLITGLSKIMFQVSSWYLFWVLFPVNYLATRRNGPWLRTFRSSFTSCEMLIVSQAIMICLGQALICELSFIEPAFRTSCSNDLPVKTLQILFLGLSLTVIIMSYTLRSGNFVTYSILGICIFLIYSRLFMVLDKEPISWLLFDVLFHHSRIYLIELWACLFLLAIFFCVLVGSFGQQLPNTIIRKFFHLLIIPVYATGLKHDAHLLYFLSACLLWILLLLECLRILDPQNAGKLIDFFMDRLKNENDRGFITLTHIYLLIGLSLSLWLAPSLENIQFNFVSGIVTVGVGDTAAALIGSLFGRHKWSGSSKTIEGSLGATVCQILGSLIIMNYLNVRISLILVIFMSIISSLIEAKTVQIDNLLIPLYFNIIWLFFHILSIYLL